MWCAAFDPGLKEIKNGKSSFKARYKPSDWSAKAGIKGLLVIFADTFCNHLIAHL